MRLIVPGFDPSWQARTSQPVRRALRTAAVDVMIFVLLFAIGEAGVRVFLPGYKRFIFTETMTGGHPQTRNAFGLRDREFPKIRPAGEDRVLCLGDSTTRGAGVALEDTFAKQLELMLNVRESDSRHRVINAGGEGRSLIHALEFLKGDGLRFNPSAVVIGFSPSMLAVLSRERAAAMTPVAPARESAARIRMLRSFAVDGSHELLRSARHLHRFLHRSYFYVFCNASLRRELYRWGILRDSMSTRTGAVFAYAFDVRGVRMENVERAYGLLEKSVAEIDALLRERGIPLMIVGIPSQFRISEERIDNRRGFDLGRIRVEPLDRMAVICRRVGVPYVDLTPRLREVRREMVHGSRVWDDLYIEGDYAHLNPQGHRLAAAAILDVLDAHGWLTESGGM